MNFSVWSQLLTRNTVSKCQRLQANSIASRMALQQLTASRFFATTTPTTYSKKSDSDDQELTDELSKVLAAVERDMEKQADMDRKFASIMNERRKPSARKPSAVDPSMISAILGSMSTSAPVSEEEEEEHDELEEIDKLTRRAMKKSRAEKEIERFLEKKKRGILEADDMRQLWKNQKQEVVGLKGNQQIWFNTKKEPTNAKYRALMNETREFVWKNRLQEADAAIEAGRFKIDDYEPLDGETGFDKYGAPVKNVPESKYEEIELKYNNGEAITAEEEALLEQKAELEEKERLRAKRSSSLLDPDPLNPILLAQIGGSIRPPRGEMPLIKEDAMEQLSDKAIEDLMLKYPGLSRAGAEVVLSRVAEAFTLPDSALPEGEIEPDQKQLAISTISDELSKTTQPINYTYANLLVRIMSSKFTQTDRAFKQLAARRVKESEMKEVMYNMATIDSDSIDDDWEYFYQVLKPVINSRITRREENLGEPELRPRIVDANGVSSGIGRRKTAVCKVWIKQGEGKFIVNGKPHYEYFTRERNRFQLLLPFHVSGTLGQFDVKANVHGGGLAAQAEAIRLGLSRAISNFAPEKRFELRNVGLLTRDPRMVERKKPGQKKARKKFQWVKR
eukprot:GEZU01017210.1.p1 GENE.GEZU01017210.1~~GEZU01017210.1.p1  ORF type:complete len:620 (-),score=197.20 GEZU01017210.1:278-2137(-)